MRQAHTISAVRALGVRMALHQRRFQQLDGVQIKAIRGFVGSVPDTRIRLLRPAAVIRRSIGCPSGFRAPAALCNSAARRPRRCRSWCRPCAGRRRAPARHRATGRQGAPRRGGRASNSRRASARPAISCCRASSDSKGQATGSSGFPSSPDQRPPPCVRDPHPGDLDRPVAVHGREPGAYHVGHNFER
jgi:hypothetical protein